MCCASLIKSQPTIWLRPEELKLGSQKVLMYFFSFLFARWHCNFSQWDEWSIMYEIDRTTKRGLQINTCTMSTFLLRRTCFSFGVHFILRLSSKDKFVRASISVVTDVILHAFTVPPPSHPATTHTYTLQWQGHQQSWSFWTFIMKTNLTKVFLLAWQKRIHTLLASKQTQTKNKVAIN